MFNMFARLLAWFRDGGNGARRACYGIVVSCVWMLLFCVLAATVSVWKAFAFASLSLAAFGVVDYLAPDSWCVGRRGGAGAERESTAAAARRFGLAQPAIDALATFAYASRGAEGSGDLESGSDNLCSVCLEDIQAGEMVRQLPTCKHLFHVECIDMWLHSHRTCPLCRCDLSPPRKILAKVPTVETELPAGDALPPVATVETEPPADDALPPV